MQVRERTALEKALMLADEFADKYERGSERTAQAYRNTMKNLLKRLYEAGLCVDPNHIGEREANFILDFSIADTTKQNYIIILKRFCHVMSDKENRNTNLEEMFLKFDLSIKNKKTLEYEDYQKALSMIKEPCMRIAFVLGSELGLRRSEICKLKVEDIQGDWIMIVRGKGKKTSRLPIGDTLMSELQIYLKKRKHIVNKYFDDAGGALIVKEWGGVRPLTASQFYQYFVRTMKKIGLDTSPHSLRSMYITNKLDSGVPIHMVKKLARHENINMTERYYRPDDNLMRMAQNVKVDRSDPIGNAAAFAEKAYMSRKKLKGEYIY